MESLDERIERLANSLFDLPDAWNGHIFDEYIGQFIETGALYRDLCARDDPLSVTGLVMRFAPDGTLRISGGIRHKSEIHERDEANYVHWMACQQWETLEAFREYLRGALEMIKTQITIAIAEAFHAIP